MASPPPPPPPPELLEELVGEILLRIPPDEPAHLVRAALVCKPWLRTVTDRTFRRRYREHHRALPLLGFLHNLYDTDGPIPRFVPTTAAGSPCSAPALRCCSWWALDARHGRVLIHTFAPTELLVWDPVTGERHRLPLPPYEHAYYTGAVLCAAAGCDHLDCHGGPFSVVFVGTDDETPVTWASVYSSETRAWSDQSIADFSASTEADDQTYVETRPSLLIGDDLYFTLQLGKSFLKYSLDGQGLAVIDAPVGCDCDQTCVLMTTEDGRLGLAAVEGRRSLHLWSWLSTGAAWTSSSVILLPTLLIGNPMRSPSVIGFAEGTDTLFVDTDSGVFALRIKSGETNKVGEAGAYDTVVPYMSFCSL